jgi:hypothetical protein
MYGSRFGGAKLQNFSIYLTFTTQLRITKDELRVKSGIANYKKVTGSASYLHNLTQAPMPAREGQGEGRDVSFTAMGLKEARRGKNS